LWPQYKGDQRSNPGTTPYARNFPPGQISLGGNCSQTSYCNNYSAVVTPVEAVANFKSLADLFGWNDVAVAELLKAYARENPEPQALTALLDLSRAMNLSQGTGISVTLLRSLAIRGFMFGAEGAQPLLQALETAAPEEAQRVRDTITDMKRNILKILAMPLIDKQISGTGMRVRDDNDLSDYLLIDTGMDACADTSPVVQATLTLQQYMQLCLLGLEPGVTDVNISDKRLDWMSGYRTWEANRRVFVYPENYLRPELRKDKTPLFEEVERTLASGPLDPKRAREVLSNYLDGLAKIANLEVVGAYYQDGGLIEKGVSLLQSHNIDASTGDFELADSGALLQKIDNNRIRLSVLSDTYHIVARTTTEP